MTTSDDVRATCRRYSAVRAVWRQSVSAEKYPAERDYHYTLEEEAALTAVALALDFQKPLYLDSPLATLRDAGLVEAWILLTGVDARARDYAAYRRKHRLRLRT
jgi:hypothetical protein